MILLNNIGQDNYSEVWCEKDALSGVLSRVTREYHIRLLINRGYSSATAMYDAAQRMEDKNAHILYFGDHDPSGLDMIRDIEDRLAQFECCPQVHRLALTGKQIEKYDPPSNPAKWKDKRAEKYVAQFGETCWEVDALPPDVLVKILEDSIESLIDRDLYDEVIAEEWADIKKLKRFINRSNKKK